MTIKTIGLESVKSVYFTEYYQPKKALQSLKNLSWWRG